MNIERKVDGKGWTSKANFFPLTDEEKRIYLSRLKEYPNFATWQINGGSEIAEVAGREETDTSAASETGDELSEQPGVSAETAGDESPKEVEGQASKLKLITVLDFESANIPEQETYVLVDLLSSALFESRQFRVLDRTQREGILNEIEYSYEDCVDEACQIEVGKLLSADYIVVGSLANISSRYIFNTKLI